MVEENDYQERCNRFTDFETVWICLTILWNRLGRFGLDDWFQEVIYIGGEKKKKVEQNHMS